MTEIPFSETEIPTVDEMLAQVASETLEETLDRLEPMAERLRASNELRKQITRASYNMGRCLDIRWTCRGLLCGIATSPQYGMNGYVKLPKPLFDITEDYDALRVNCHGGLTYGPDSGRWVGFDCAHAGDIWPWREVAPYLAGNRKRIYSHRLLGYGGGCGILAPGGGPLQALRNALGTHLERAAAARRSEPPGRPDQARSPGREARTRLVVPPTRRVTCTGLELTPHSDGLHGVSA